MSGSEYPLKGSIYLVGERHRQEGPWRLSNVYWRNTRSITPPLPGNLSPRSRYILIYQLRKACLGGENLDLRNPLRNPFRVASSLPPLRDTATSLRSTRNEAVSSTRLPGLWKSSTSLYPLTNQQTEYNLSEIRLIEKYKSWIRWCGLVNYK